MQGIVRKHYILKKEWNHVSFPTLIGIEKYMKLIPQLIIKGDEFELFLCLRLKGLEEGFYQW